MSLKLMSDDGSIEVFYDEKNVIKKIKLNEDFSEKPADLNIVKGIDKLTSIDVGYILDYENGFHLTSKKPISNLILPDTIREIGKGAFRENRVLRGIRWPSGCFEIKEETFTNSSLSTITNVEHVKNIGSWAFSGSSIKEFTVPSEVFEIPDNCFYHTPLSEIKNAGHLKNIGEGAFNCTKLKEFVFPANCPTIGQITFSECPKLRVVDIRESVCFYIDYGAFYKSDLVTVYLGYWTKVNDGAFKNSNGKIVEYEGSNKEAK